MTETASDRLRASMKRYRISRDELTVRSEQLAARAAREQATEFVNGGPRSMSPSR